MNGKKCNVPACKRPAKSRGCCSACYLAIRREIKSKRATTEEVAEVGLFDPITPMSDGRGRTIGIAIAELRKRLAEKKTQHDAA